MLRRLDGIERRLRDTQAMATRAYEASFQYARVLDEIRNEPGYDAAFLGEPLVSVRIATYNQSDLLCARSLATLRRQSYERWEALVVGDACTDDTAERVAAIGDPRIRFWNLPVRGPYPEDAQARWYVAGLPPMNAGILASRGAWIAPLDHDDEWDDDHIEVLLETAQREHAELAYSRLRVINDTNGDTSEIGRWPPERGQFAFQGALHHAGLKRFLYDMNCRFADEPGDWNLARRMWSAGVRFAYVDRPTGTYHHVPKHAGPLDRGADDRGAPCLVCGAADGTRVVEGTVGPVRERAREGARKPRRGAAMIRFQTPQLPPLEDVARYFELAERDRWYSNSGPCARPAHRAPRDARGSRCALSAGRERHARTHGRAPRADLGSREGAAEVLVPTFTFVATINAIAWAGLTPVFVDLDPDDWHPSHAAIEHALSTRAGRVAAVLSTLDLRHATIACRPGRVSSGPAPMRACRC